MKYLLCFFLGILGLLNTSLHNQRTELPFPQIDQIVLSLKNSSSKDLAQYFDTTVEIKLGDSRGD